MNTAIHATALLVGERGLLLRGASGAGKSLLALALIERVRRAAGFAALISDDRVWLDAVHGRLVAKGRAQLAGLCERRSEGLIETPHEPRAVLALIVDLAVRGQPPPRMPEAADRYATLCGIELPRLLVDLAPGVDDGVSATLSALLRLEGSRWRKNVNDDVLFA